jgi:hypothetical protein
MINIRWNDSDGNGEHKKGPHDDFLKNYQLAKDWAHAPHQGPIELMISLTKITLNFSYKSPDNGNYCNPINMHQPYNKFMKEVNETFKEMCSLIYKDKERIRKTTQESQRQAKTTQATNKPK